MWRQLAIVTAVLLLNAGVVVQITGVAYEPFSWQAFAQVYLNNGEPPVGDNGVDPDADAIKGSGRDLNFEVFNPSGCFFNLATGTIVPGGSVTASSDCSCTEANIPKGADPMDGSMGCFAFSYDSGGAGVTFDFTITPLLGCTLAAECPDQGSIATSSINPNPAGEQAVSIGNFPDDALTTLPAECTPWASQVVLDDADASAVVNAAINNNIPLDCSALCGNNLIDTQVGEQCDDANSNAGDGCDSDCLPEPGFTCPGTPGRCLPICGDGMVVFGEGCDDANVMAGDGCSASCQTEPGFFCPVPGAPCIEFVAPAPALSAAALAAALLVLLSAAFFAMRRRDGFVR
jgi:cysteine-rich repeat protein